MFTIISLFVFDTPNNSPFSIIQRLSFILLDK
jgi:hypothetical protein